MEETIFEIIVSYSEDNYEYGSMIINTFNLKTYEFPMSYDRFVELTKVKTSEKEITMKGNKASSFLKSPNIVELIKMYK